MSKTSKETPKVRAIDNKRRSTMKTKRLTEESILDMLAGCEYGPVERNETPWGLEWVVWIGGMGRPIRSIADLRRLREELADSE